jgi:hypothetical protein
MGTEQWIALVVGAAAAFAAWRKALQPVWGEWRTRRRAGSSLARYHALSSAAERWLHRHQAGRVLVMQAENSGWEDPATPVYVSVVAEHSEEGDRVWDRWQRWSADTPYRSMLSSVVSADGLPVIIRESDMPDSELRDYYRERRIFASVLFLISATDSGGLLYGVINFGGPDRDPRESGMEADELAGRREQVRLMILEARRAYHGRAGVVSGP